MPWTHLWTSKQNKLAIWYFNASYLNFLVKLTKYLICMWISCVIRSGMRGDRLQEEKKIHMQENLKSDKSIKYKLHMVFLCCEMKNALATHELTVAAWRKTPRELSPGIWYDDRHNLFVAQGTKYSSTNFLQLRMLLTWKKEHTISLYLAAFSERNSWRSKIEWTRWWAPNGSWPSIVGPTMSHPNRRWDHGHL